VTTHKRVGNYKRISLDDVKARVYAKHGDAVVLDEATFVNTVTKARFVDHDYGDWWALPTLVTKGRGHPTRGNKLIADSKRYNVSKVVQMVRKAHGDVVTLDVLTYVDMQTKAQFIDSVHGSWSAWPGHIVRGGGHPNRRNEKAAEGIRISMDEIRARIRSHHGDTVVLDETTYTGRTTNKARFVDKDYGEWWAVIYKVAGNGHGHPARRVSKATETMSLTPAVRHWKTDELCFGRGSYERAVLLWLNEKCYDFTWQPMFVTPFITLHGKNRVYYVDVYVKDGPYADTYIEIKGTWARANGDLSRAKWEWFHAVYPNSVLWMKPELKRLSIID
jgi:hypothetical protein